MVISFLLQFGAAPVTVWCKESGSGMIIYTNFLIFKIANIINFIAGTMYHHNLGKHETES